MKNLNISIYDDQDTIVKKVAYGFSTIPRLLINMPLTRMADEPDIVSIVERYNVKDLKTEALHFENNTHIRPNLRSSIRAFLAFYRTDSTDAIMAFAAYGQGSEPSVSDSVWIGILEQELETIIGDVDAWKRDVEKETSELDAYILKQEGIYAIVNNTPEHAFLTREKYTGASLRISYEFKEMTLPLLYDYIVPNLNYTTVIWGKKRKYFGKYGKVLTTDNESGDTIYILGCDNTRVVLDLKEQIGTIEIVVDEYEKLRRMSKDDVFTMLGELIPIPKMLINTISSPKVYKLNVEFMVNNQSFYAPMFLDFLFFHIVGNRFMRVNEQTRKSKSESSRYTVKGTILDTVSIRMRHRLHTTLSLTTNSILDLPVNTPYVYVKLSNVDPEKVNLVKMTVGKLFIIFNTAMPDILTDYREHYNNLRDVLPSIESELGLQQIALTKLGDYAPGIFLENYSKFVCEPKRNPVRVETAEAEAYASHQKIQFPPGERYAQWYVCPSAEFPYMGLAENKLENRQEFPRLPCCFKKAQTLETETTTAPVISSNIRRILVSQTFAGYGVYGELPKPIQRVLQQVESDGELFLRLGCLTDTDSTIECMLRATGKLPYAIEQSTQSQTRIRSLCQDTKEQLKTFALANPQLLLQSYSMHACKRPVDMELSHHFINPLFFASLLEEFFNINLYIFSREPNSAATLAQPYCIDRYCGTHRSNRPLVLVYLHTGEHSTKDYQCELIVKGKYKQGSKGKSAPVDVECQFRDNAVSEHLTRVYTFLFGCSPYKTDIPIILSQFPTEQYVDSYGKCRLLAYNVNGRYYIIKSSQPIAPVKNATLVPYSFMCKKAVLDPRDLPEPPNQYTWFFIDDTAVSDFVTECKYVASRKHAVQCIASRRQLNLPITVRKGDHYSYIHPLISLNESIVLPYDEYDAVMQQAQLVPTGTYVPSSLLLKNYHQHFVDYGKLLA